MSLSTSIIPSARPVHRRATETTELLSSPEGFGTKSTKITKRKQLLMLWTP